jgi:SAM-dependent methyltransferase
MRELFEISDLIVDYDVETLERRRVSKAEVEKRLRDNGQGRAARLVSRLPAPGGVLDEATCDGILLRSHAELQRLSEEFLQADRARELLLNILRVLREAGVPPPYRVVDVGCGLGYLVRALAAHGRLGRDVELIGCDMNRGLLEPARALAEEEALLCDFRLANAFRLDEPAHIFLSTGVLHHFRGPALQTFFANQRHAWAFVHYDMQASAVSPLGSWIFHTARMREPLARHDGVVSACRAHSARALLEASRQNDFTCADLDGATDLLGAVLRPMHALVGLRTALWPAFTARLGDRQRRLVMAG